MSKKYRVIVWGPGVTGKNAVKILLKRPEFEIVGCLAYSPEKHGVDLGTLIGIEPIGVAATTDKDEIYNMDADCVLHMARLMPDQTPMHEEVFRILESGKNVISSTAYYYPPFYGADFVEKLETACKKGNTTVYGTGIHPAVVNERVLLASTGLCDEISYIEFTEYAKLDRHPNPVLLEAIGLNLTSEQFEARRDEVVLESFGPFYLEKMAFVINKIFGLSPEDIRYETSLDCEIAEEDSELVKKGRSHLSTQSYKAFDEDRLLFAVNVVVYRGMNSPPRPDISSESCYFWTIEGKPVSVECKFEDKASAENNSDIIEGDPDALPVAVATVVSLIQSITVVCEAKPGIFYDNVSIHAANDYRRLIE